MEGRPTFLIDYPLTYMNFLACSVMVFFSKKQINFKNSRLSVAGNKTQLKLT